MPKLTVKVQKTIALELSEEEVFLLLGILQNQPSEDEPEEYKKFRKSLFDLLRTEI